MAVSPMLIKVAAALLTSEKGRKGVGFLLIAIFAPVILIAADPLLRDIRWGRPQQSGGRSVVLWSQLYGFRAC